MWLIFYFFMYIFVSMKNMIFLDYDSERKDEEIRIGKPNYEPKDNDELESELLKADVDLLTGGLIKLINEAHKRNYLDKESVLDNVISKLVKEKYDKRTESDAL